MLDGLAVGGLAERLGAEPLIMDLSEAIAAVKAGTLDAQENPFLNTVNYGVHMFHRYHTATNHFYLSRPIFLHRPSFYSKDPMEEEARKTAEVLARLVRFSIST